MVLHKQLKFEVLSWEIFNIGEICTSGASFTCVGVLWMNYICISHWANCDLIYYYAIKQRIFWWLFET